MDSESPTRLRDRRTGLLIVASAFIAGLCISWWARTVSAPEPELNALPTVAGVLGFPHRVDVLGTLEAAHDAAKRDELLGIDVMGASNDGTVDVSMPGNRIRYVFGSNRGQGALPPHPPGTLPRHDACGRHGVHVRADGMLADPDQPDYPCGGPLSQPVPYPRCGPKEVWQRAKGRGLPNTARAHLQYYRSAAGPAWRIEVPGTTFSLALYGDCERELNLGESRGAPP